MASLVPAGPIYGEVASINVEKIFGALAVLLPILQPILPLLIGVGKLFGNVLGTLSGAKISTLFVKFLPLQSLKNFYVAGTVAFFTIIAVGKIVLKIVPFLFPILFPILIILAALNGIIGGLLGFIVGVLSDILHPELPDLGYG